MPGKKTATRRKQNPVNYDLHIVMSRKPEGKKSF